jgi:uncharacterized protein (TIRG00374 family)
MLLMSGVALYVFAPTLIQMFEASDDLAQVAGVWLVVAFFCQLGSFACVWVLQRLAFRDASWFTVITSQLASNAFSRVVPGGAAAGGALQFRMLKVAGTDTTSAVTGLTAISLITTGSVFALPLISVPFILAGVPVPENLALTAWIGTVLFLVMMALGAWLLVFDGPLQWAGELAERIRLRLGREPSDPPLPEQLVEERDELARSLGRHWQWAVAVALGKWLLDFYTLVAALAATGDDTRVSLVLLAYVAGAVLAMIPITPGGLGFVEAGLVSTLVAAGVAPARAVLATLAYRAVSYWLPLAAGLIAFVWFRLRHRALPSAMAPVPATIAAAEEELAAAEGELTTDGVREAARRQQPRELDRRREVGQRPG